MPWNSRRQSGMKCSKTTTQTFAVPKFGMRYQPFDETLTLRATWGKGFREPSLIELYASPTSALTGANDTLPESLGGPATPVGDPSRFESETPVVITSSPVLTPEDSQSFSAGIVWTPKWVNGLTLSIDLWNIEQTGVVIASTTNVVLNNELNNSLQPGQEVIRNADGTIAQIFLPFVNSGNTQTNGIDFGLQYVYPTKYGTFTSVTNATWVNTFQQAVFAGLPQNELNGYTTDPFASNDGFLKWKGRLAHRLGLERLGSRPHRELPRWLPRALSQRAYPLYEPDMVLRWPVVV